MKITNSQKNWILLLLIMVIVAIFLFLFSKIDENKQMRTTSGKDIRIMRDDTIYSY